MATEFKNPYKSILKVNTRRECKAVFMRHFQEKTKLFVPGLQKKPFESLTMLLNSI